MYQSVLSKFYISNALLHYPTSINRLARVDRAVRTSNECHRLYFSYHPRDYEIFTEVYTHRTDFLPSEAPLLWFQTDGTTGAHFLGAAVSFVFTHLNRGRLIDMRFQIFLELPNALCHSPPPIYQAWWHHSFYFTVVVQKHSYRLPLALYGRETWFLITRKEQRLCLRTNCWGDVINMNLASWRQYLNGRQMNEEVTVNVLTSV